MPGAPQVPVGRQLRHGREVIENNVSTDFGSTIHGTCVNAHRLVGHHEPCPHVCMSNYPEGQSCSDHHSRCCAQRPCCTASHCGRHMVVVGDSKEAWLVDTASGRQGLIYSARHVIKRVSNRRLASYEVASTILQILPGGAWPRWRGTWTFRLPRRGTPTAACSPRATRQGMCREQTLDRRWVSTFSSSVCMFEL